MTFLNKIAALIAGIMYLSGLAVAEEKFENRISVSEFELSPSSPPSPRNYGKESVDQLSARDREDYDRRSAQFNLAYTSALDDFLWSGLDENFKTKGLGEKLTEQCTAYPAQQPPQFLGVLSFLIGPLINIVLDEVKSSLDKELEKYSAEYSGSKQVQFYTEDSTSTALKQRWRCVRFTRIKSVDVTKSDNEAVRSIVRSVDVDLLAQVRLSGDGSSLQVRPLRFFVAQPSAKGTKMGYAIGMKTDVVWRENSEGKDEENFNVVLLKHKLQKSDNHWMKEPIYIVEKEDKSVFKKWDRYSALPIFSFSEQSPKSSYVTLKITVAEVGDGDGKRTLKAIRKLFGAVQSDLASLLTEAAKELINPPEPEVEPEPKKLCGSFQYNQDTGAIVGDFTESDCASADSQ